MKKKLIILLFLTGVFLRFYNLDAFVTFLGDQGRDAVIIKRIVTFEHFPAIGAPTSLGQVYLGPFYYYFIAPWLLLFRLDPIGLAVGVATLSSLFIAGFFFIVKRFFDELTAVLATLFAVFSLALIDLSRFSWNPNLLPVFSVLTLYFFTQAIDTKKWYFFALAGALLSFSIQLHYLALFLIPGIALFLIFEIAQKRIELIALMKNGLISAASFLIFSSPLILFDLRHNFLNSKNFISLLQTSGPSSSNNALSGILDAFFFLNRFTFNAELNWYLSTVILCLILITLFMSVKNGAVSIQRILLFFLGALLPFAVYYGPKYPHYFGFIYPLYFIVVAYFLSVLRNSRVGLALIGIFFASYIFLNGLGYSFLYSKGSYQIQKAKKIARAIYDRVSEKKFTVTGLPDKYSDSTYRYFLEVWGKRPIEKDSLERADELFVVCSQPCKPIGDPQWDIAYFAPRKVASTVKTQGNIIYKLTR